MCGPSNSATIDYTNDTVAKEAKGATAAAVTADAQRLLKDKVLSANAPPPLPTLSDGLFADVRKNQAFSLLQNTGRKDSFLTGTGGVQSTVNKRQLLGL